MDEINESFLAFQVMPDQMDFLWALGWRHFGPYFFRYSQVRHRFHVLPLRVHLARFQPTRSQKRVLSRNRDLEVEYVPAFVDSDVEQLFDQHKTRFTHSIPADIYTFVSAKPATIPCPCIAITLRDRGKLVGISYLDIGTNSASSVYQCFDLEHSRRSLGILMILLSIRYCRELQKTLYYPGYAYREPSEYDYKKHLKGLEYFDWKSGWKPFPDHDEVPHPLE